MLVGLFTSKLGSKRRISFPKKFREILGDKLIVTRGYEGCLVVVDESRWNEITKDVVGGTFLDRKVRDSGRFLLAGAHEVELDLQGRFVIPEDLFDYAELSNSEKQAVFLGLGNWVEVWSIKEWREHEEYVRRNGEVIVQELADKVEGTK
ncbi:MAG: division/cell wall cluster transcriptional repressor MraZ [bacterium]